MKKTLYILIGFLWCAACQDKQKTESETSTPKFNLVKDLSNFREKLTESDTLLISFDHSVCTYQGYERIEITKKSDSLHIVSNFKEQTFDTNPTWKKIYELKIATKDTIWNFERFLERNDSRKSTHKRGILVLIHKKDTIRYSANGLIDLNRFLADYYETMRKIHPENTNGMYGVTITEE